MEKTQINPLRMQQEQEVITTLTYQGKIAAIKKYMKFSGARLDQAKMAVERLAQEIEPGPAA
jgi:ribosomal protein L7/L12